MSYSFAPIRAGGNWPGGGGSARKKPRTSVRAENLIRQRRESRETVDGRGAANEPNDSVALGSSDETEGETIQASSDEAGDVTTGRAEDSAQESAEDSARESAEDSAQESAADGAPGRAPKPSAQEGAQMDWFGTTEPKVEQRVQRMVSSPRTAPDEATATLRMGRVRALLDEAKSTAQHTEERRRRERSRDDALIQRVRDGDGGAFQELVALHQGRLFSVAFGMLRDRDDAMDVVQDVFLKVYRKLGDFEGNSAFSTWLHRIAVNLCIDRKRAMARRRQTGIDSLAEQNFEDDPLYAEADYAPRLSGHNPLRNVSDKELGRQISQALATLSDEHRAIVLLREVEGMSYEELAVVLEIPRGTVMSRLFHARKNLQRALRPVLGIAENEGPSGGPSEEGETSTSPARGQPGTKSIPLPLSLAKPQSGPDRGEEVGDEARPSELVPPAKASGPEKQP
jgi:RNA polymerase sigma-70 factor (ECF subfamily)